MMRVLIPLLTLVLLAGCGPSGGPAAGAPVAPATEANLPVDAAGSAPAYSASEGGVGPVSVETSFSLGAMTALFPGSEVKAAYLGQEGVQTPILTVFGPAELALELQEGDRKGRVGWILVQGGPVVGPRGEAILDPWTRFDFPRKDCVMGADRFRSAALCRRPDAPSLAYVFDIPGLVADGEVLPPDALLTEKAFLQAFLWQAPVAP
ncbi:MAG: DUF1131 domain-containing protein [Caulobacter sp.]|nr:DUF1131 domain-containing protein [Caulobacter sp.]